MKRGLHGSWLIGLAIAVARVSSGGDASAHGGVDEDRTPQEEPSSAARPAPGAEEPRPTGGEGGEAAERGVVGLDVVLGWGNVPFAVQNLPTTGVQAITYSRSDATPSDVQSFVLTGRFDATEHLAVGARVPFTLGTFSPAGSAARSATSLGNVEFEGELETHLGSHAKLVGALGVALPTGQGDEIPATLVGVPASSVNPGSYDRYSLSRAAALARGYEDNALFETGRLGVVPKLALICRGPRFGLESYVKVENLIQAAGSLDTPYVGEVVAGVRLVYRLGAHVEASVRGWINVGFAGTPDDMKTAVAIEPDLAVSSGALRAYAGFVAPVVGPPADAGFLGVRLGLVVSF